METINIIDVTIIEPRFKHPVIFENFDALAPGEAFIIHNDHDPKPLYYQLLGERGNIFNWEYLEEGPEFWKVRIGKFQANESKPTIGELVSGDYRKAEVFKKFGLDFCCGGKKTVEQACKTKGLDVLQVEKELKDLEAVPVSSSENQSKWDASFLTDYIVNTHHRYVREAIPVIEEYTAKVAAVHGNRHPEAIRIAELFRVMAQEITSHMIQEETVLFPYFKQVQLAEEYGIALESGWTERILAVMKGAEEEHELVGKLAKEIRQLTDNYTPPADACTTYKLSYMKLKEFEDDLHKHIHLENNILFPRLKAA